MRLFIFLNALLDVELLLLTHPFLLIVADDITHAIHHGLNAFAALGHLVLTSLLLLQGQPHVLLDLLLVLPLDHVELGLAFPLLVHVLLDHAHGSLTLLHFLPRLGVSLLKNLRRQSVNPLLLLVAMPLRNVRLLLLRLGEHDVSHFLLLNDLHLNLSFLLAFKFELLLGLLQDLLVEVLPLLLGLLAQLGPKCDLLVKHIAHLLLRLFVLGLLHLDLLLV